MNVCMALSKDAWIKLRLRCAPEAPRSTVTVKAQQRERCVLGLEVDLPVLFCREGVAAAADEVVACDDIAPTSENNVPDCATFGDYSTKLVKDTRTRVPPAFRSIVQYLHIFEDDHVTTAIFTIMGVKVYTNPTSHLVHRIIRDEGV